MKNLLIRRPMIEQAGTQSQEIHIQFPSIEVRHCTAFGGSVQDDVAGLLISPSFNQHEESPDSKTGDGTRKYSKSGDLSFTPPSASL